MVTNHPKLQRMMLITFRIVRMSLQRIFFPDLFDRCTLSSNHQTLRIPFGSEWEPAWLRRANQPEHFAQRRALCRLGLRHTLPSRVEATAFCCAQLSNAHHLRSQPARLAWRSAGGARGARTRSTSRTRSPHSAAQRPPISLGPRAREFWISVPFSPPRRDERRTILTGSAGLWVAIYSEWGNKGDIALLQDLRGKPAPRFVQAEVPVWPGGLNVRTQLHGLRMDPLRLRSQGCRPHHIAGQLALRGGAAGGGARFGNGQTRWQAPPHSAAAWGPDCDRKSAWQGDMMWGNNSLSR